MSFGLSGAAIGGIVAGAGALGGAYLSSKAAGDASDAQSASAAAGQQEVARQFDQIQQLLSPYVTAGTGALGAQQNLLGLNGNDAQQAAIDAIQNSPAFTSALKTGETSLLQNASATGGLRGGNIQSALAQFSPNLLTQLIQSQLSNLGGLTSIGQNAAAGVGNAGMQTGNTIAGLIQQGGAAQAGGALAQGAAANSALSGLTGAYGTYQGIQNQQALLAALQSGGFGNSYVNNAAVANQGGNLAGW